jgi:hypothetical protein
MGAAERMNRLISGTSSRNIPASPGAEEAAAAAERTKLGVENTRRSGEGQRHGAGRLSGGNSPARRRRAP